MTSEGTEFVDDGNGGVRCLACDGVGYSLMADGPRCNRCWRFVLKDSGASNPPMEVVDEMIEETVDRAAWSTPLTMRDVEEAIESPGPPVSGYAGKMAGGARQPQAPVDEWDLGSVFTEVDAILQEGRGIS